jgi:tetrahydromethanopterin S-methyltransferase subunit F
MTPDQHHNQDSRHRAKAGQTDKSDLRLQQLEAEIHQQSQLDRQQATTRSLNRRLISALNVAKFIGIVVGVILLMRIATWLASVAIVGGVVWVIYKLFFAPDKPQT